MNNAPDTPRFRLDKNDLRKFGYRIVDIIAEEHGNSNVRPIYPRQQDRLHLELLFGGALPETGQDVDELLDLIAAEFLPASANYMHPRMLGYIASSPLPVSGLLEALVGSLRLFPYTWALTPASSLVEITVARWLGEMTGFDNAAAGYMTTGGSWANLMALAVARHRHCGWDVKTEGHWNRPPLAAYTSQEAHSCHEQSVKLLGLGTRYLRKIPVDHRFRIDTGALRTAIDSDIQAGLKPFCIIANAGTTNTGAVDPLNEMADIAAHYEMWFHIDGSYGAFAALDPSVADSFKGVERADSITLDPHKWLNIPFEAGCLLTHDWKILSEAFSILPPYLEMGHSEDHHDHWNHGFELTRNDRALKVWMALRQYGVDAFRQMICSHIKLAKTIAHWIEAAEDFDLASEPSLSVCCFRYTPVTGHADNERENYLNTLNSRIEEALIADGGALMTGTVLRGKRVFRACIVNHKATWHGIEETLLRIRKIGKNLEKN